MFDDSSVFSTPAPGPWRWEGACVGMGNEMWFPTIGQRPAEAIEVCRGCLVRRECAEYALEHNQHWGVWGGLTERQRFDVKRHRRLGVEHPLDPSLF